jgi:two-component SAPR family response regulator
LFTIFNNKQPIDIIICDPDLPDNTNKDLIQKIKGYYPSIPLIIHTLGHDVYAKYVFGMYPIMIVEKEGNSIDKLKSIIKQYR